MTTRELVAVERALATEVPGFVIQKSLMFIPPVKNLLRGIHFQGSSFSKTKLYANMFVMPLCMPKEGLKLTYGNRVRHNGVGDIWDKELVDLVATLAEAVKNYALPFLNQVNSLPGFIEYLEPEASTFRDWQALATTLAQAGRFEESLGYCDRVLAGYDQTVPWQVSVKEEIETLKGKILINPEDALQQLEAWEIQTVSSLGLTAFRSSL